MPATALHVVGAVRVAADAGHGRGRHQRAEQQRARDHCYGERVQRGRGSVGRRFVDQLAKPLGYAAAAEPCDRRLAVRIVDAGRLADDTREREPVVAAAKGAEVGVALELERELADGSLPGTTRPTARRPRASTIP